MKIKTIVSLLLFILLVSCTPVAPTTAPTATMLVESSAIETQTLPDTITPIPSATLTQTSAPILTATPTPASGANYLLERIAQTGGSIQGITLVGDVAYVGMGPRVAAIDISQHKTPRLVTQSEPLPGLVTQVIQISGVPAPRLLVNAGKYLVLVDCSNPEQINPIQRLELDGAITAMVWDEQANILYAGGSVYQSPGTSLYTGFISAVAINPSDSLELVDSVDMPEMPFSLALGKGSLFAGANGYEGGLYYIQINNPGELSSPLQVIPSTPEEPLVPTSMQIIGDILYLGYWGVDAYDITDPVQPVKIWSDSVPQLNIVTSFTIDGDQFYVTGFTIKEPGIQVRGTFTAPDPIEGLPMGEVASITTMHNGEFIVADRNLDIYDSADPEDLHLVGSFKPPVTNAIDAVVNEKAIFTVDIGVGDGLSNAILWALSLPDLEPLGQVTTEIPNSRWNGLCGIALDGDRVYLAAINSLWVYDVSRSLPTLVGNIEMVDGELDAIAAITSGGMRVLVMSQVSPDYSSLLTAYDLTDLEMPVELGTPLTLDQGNTVQMIWNESALYVLLDTSYHADNDLLYVIDFDQNALILRESLKLPANIEHMAVDNHLIMLAGIDRNRSFVSLVQAQPLVFLSDTALPKDGMGLAIINDKALVDVGDEHSELFGAAQLLAFDLQDPANITQIEVIDLAFSDNHRVPILSINSHVILANGAGGVEVFKYNP